MKDMEVRRRQLGKELDDLVKSAQGAVDIVVSDGAEYVSKVSVRRLLLRPFSNSSKRRAMLTTRLSTTSLYKLSDRWSSYMRCI